MDYWAAQALLAKTESVDEISVLAKEGVAVAGLKAKLARALPGYVNIEEPQLRKEGGTRILGSLEFLLGSVGMLVMVVAFFVAYNTFQVAFLRRSREFGILRLEGATTTQLIGFLLTETLLIRRARFASWSMARVLARQAQLLAGQRNGGHALLPYASP